MIQAFILLILLWTVPSTLSLTPQRLPTPGLRALPPPICYAPDRGPDGTWRDSCHRLVDHFIDEPDLPNILHFGGPGGIPVPYIYRGPVGQTSSQCEARLDLLNDARSETIAKFQLYAVGKVIIRSCVEDQGGGSGGREGGHYLGGRETGLGRGGSLNVGLGKIPVPGPPSPEGNMEMTSERPVVVVDVT